MHGILHVTLLVAITLVQVDTRGYIIHPQPWILTRRALHDDSLRPPHTIISHQRSVRSDEEGDTNGYLVYSTDSPSQEKSEEGGEFRAQQDSSARDDDEEASEYEKQIDSDQRNRYRDEPLNDYQEVEDDEDFSADFRNQNSYEQQQQQENYAHSPYPYEDDGYDQENMDDEAQSQDSAGYGDSYGQGLQLETNAEPYDDEVAAKENNEENPQDDVYSLEYQQNDRDDSQNSNSNYNNYENSESQNSNEGNSVSEGSNQASSETSDKNDDSQVKGDEGSGSEEDDYAADDIYDDYGDDYAYDDKGGGKKGGQQKKPVKAPFWHSQDYLLGSAKGGAGWGVQGPPVYFRDGEPEWPPEHGGGGKGKGKGKGGKGKGKSKGKGKGKKGKKGGGQKKHGWHHGWGGWERIGNGGWGDWPKGWISANNLDTGGQRWVEGKGWTGETGAPWIPKREMHHHWGFPLGWGKMEETGHGGKKKGKGKSKGGGKKKKKKCKKGKGKGRKGGKGGKGGGKKGGGCGESGWGWPKPHFVKLKPMPPRGSQVWLKKGSGWPQKPIGGWTPTRGWDILRKFAGGWMLPDLVGVVNLNG